jgi:Putative S-adenosyl-L-methionine-dependent methyltransferase
MVGAKRRPSGNHRFENGAADMVIHLNCLGRAQSGDLTPILPALSEVSERIDLDHTRLGVVLDWVQYRRNFREPVVVRRFVPVRDNGGAGDGPYAEIALDVRRVKDLDPDVVVREILAGLSATGNGGSQKAASNGGSRKEEGDRLFLEEWARPSKSVIWAFNRSYWRHLSAWDSTFDRDYAAALPGGVSDGSNPAFWRDRVDAFVQTLERLDQWSELPDEIHVVELGVGDGAQARVWLDTFAQVCEEKGHDYLKRVRYVMADYSPDVLEQARQRVAPYADNVRHLDIDFRSPLDVLAHLRAKVLFAHACNLHDNLPTDEVMRVGDRAYEVLVRAYLKAPKVAEICAAHGIRVEDVVATIQRVLREGPDALGDQRTGVMFWSEVWDALGLEETYVEIGDPSSVRLAPGVGLPLSELLGTLPEWTRVHLSSVAVESFAQTLELLHPEGVFQVQDLFVRDVSQYASFRGPGKVEGSIVNWLNGPLFRMIGERLGFHVSLEPFTYREGSNTVVFSARRRDASGDGRMQAVAEELLPTTVG